MKIQTLNKIAKIGLDGFDGKYEICDTCDAPDGILVRSASLHDMELPTSLLAVARAGAGVNNIPLDTCAEKGIVVFNTPGANANAVKELAITALLLSSRDVIGGVEWAKTLTGDDVAKQVEKGKSQFVGPEIRGKKLGVIGLGAIGVLVANAAQHLGMKVVGYDPYISLQSAWNLNHHVEKAANIDEIYANCDYICLHAPLTAETKHSINKDTIATMKDGVRILNLSRADLVNDEDIAEALESGKVAKYVTDFPNAKTLTMKNAIPIPHLGASTPESEDNCAVMAVNEIREYLEEGNITNSVNYPAVSTPFASALRICICHRNVPNMISTFSTIVSAVGVNIENMINKSKGDYAYTIIDCSENVADRVVDTLSAVDGVLRVRAIVK
ncbi:MAG: phosphoglycerate dehydrogenase [Clostridia bacterium]|nr:phosphoglycerate dehydrogenase [Clostridia bacterium]